VCIENRVLWIILGPKRDKVTGEWRKYIMRSLMICTPQSIFWVLKPRRMRWVGHIAHMGVWGGGRVEVSAGFWWENWRERDNLKDPGTDERYIMRT